MTKKLSHSLLAMIFLGFGFLSVSCAHKEKCGCGDSCKMEKMNKSCPDCKDSKETGKDSAKEPCKDCKDKQ